MSKGTLQQQVMILNALNAIRRREHMAYTKDVINAVQFRKWTNQIVKDYTIKGFATDDERLKNDSGNCQSSC